MQKFIFCFWDGVSPYLKSPYRGETVLFEGNDRPFVGYGLYRIRLFSSNAVYGKYLVVTPVIAMKELPNVICTILTSLGVKRV